MQDKTINKYIKYILFGIILLGITYMFFTGRIMSKKLKEKGVYKLGIISDIRNGKNGALHTCNYIYHGESFTTKFTAAGLGLQKGNLIFINFLPSDPEICNPLYETKVPSCLTIESSPEEGWKKLPPDTCR
jgi:hypothetical protein